MSADPRPFLAGRVGRAHGLDGSFYLEQPGELLEEGVLVHVGDRQLPVERVAGSHSRPLIRLGEVRDRASAEALRGEPVLVRRTAGELGEGEYLSADLVGCIVDGIGTVRRVIPGPSCDLLEVGDDALLIPFVRDAVTRVDAKSGVIEVDRRFLGLD
ncbi:MAG: ribosome maturation factor RimM [Thermoleophilaceae bacterium]